MTKLVFFSSFVSMTFFLCAKSATYVPGGMKLLNCGFVMQTQVNIFNFKAAKWCVGKSLPRGLAGSGNVAFNGNVHMIGGTVGDCVKWGPTDEMLVFHPDTNGFTHARSMPHKLSEVSAFAVDNNRIVAMGTDYIDSLGGGALHTLVYDANTLTWTQGPHAPTTRKGFAAAYAPNSSVVVVTGGKSFDLRVLESVHRTVEIYHVARAVWLPGPPMITPRFDHSAVVIDNTVYVCGGVTASGELSFVETNKCEKLVLNEDGSADGKAWQEMAPLVKPRSRFTLYYSEDPLLVAFGGRSNVNPETLAFKAPQSTWVYVPAGGLENLEGAKGVGWLDLPDTTMQC